LSGQRKATGPRGQTILERRTRLATGLVLFTFVLTHLLNHALGMISLEAMEAGRRAFLALWRSAPGTLALAASILLHLALALRSIYLRRMFRMPAWEALQLLFGLAIPLLVINHAVATRLANERFGFEDSYAVLVLLLWETRPDLGLQQALLLTIAWIHGCIGMHFWLRLRAGYPRWAMPLYTFAVLIPVLALLGFAQAGKEVSGLATRVGWIKDTFAAARFPDESARAALHETGQAILYLLIAALVFTLALRAIRLWHEGRSAIRVTYPGSRMVTVPLGFSLLECSRYARIPHASVCGGRGRCSTCRVRIVAGLQALSPPSAVEARVLQRVGAGPDVRLACQSRPTGDISIIPLMPANLMASRALSQQGAMTGEEREICVLFADIRGFTRLSERRLPYDVVFFLNRYFEVTSNAIEQAGGIANQFTGDGVMALFGVHTAPAVGALQALEAARALTRAVARLSEDLRGELAAPLRIGIGIHCGPAVVGQMGHGVATYLTAVGDTVNTASRLQDQTKEFDCQAIISEPVAERAGVDVSGFPRQEVTVRNRAAPIAIRIIADVEALQLPAP
jgi:adenylate cyclase